MDLLSLVLYIGLIIVLSLLIFQPFIGQFMAFIFGLMLMGSPAVTASEHMWFVIVVSIAFAIGAFVLLFGDMTRIFTISAAFSVGILWIGFLFRDFWLGIAAFLNFPIGGSTAIVGSMTIGLALVGTAMVSKLKQSERRRCLRILGREICIGDDRDA